MTPETCATLPAAWPADSEIHHHLYYRPYIKLDIPFDPAPMLAEAEALLEFFVSHRDAGQSEDGKPAWRSLALQARGGSYRETQFADDQHQAFQKTEMAARCPETMTFLESITDFSQCMRVRFMLLEPGGKIRVHQDFTDQLFPAGMAINISLNMPEGCRFVADCNPDGTDNPYTVEVPFEDSGSVILFNNAKYHFVENHSDTPRIHIIFHGPLRYPPANILQDARTQNGLSHDYVLLKSIAKKHLALGHFDPPNEELNNMLKKDHMPMRMLPDSVKMFVLDFPGQLDQAQHKEQLYKTTLASLFPHQAEVVKPEQLDNTLQALPGHITHAVILALGTYIQKPDEFVLGLFTTLNRMHHEEALAAGHLIGTIKDHGNLPYLHEQFAVLDLDKWRRAGQPDWAPVYGHEEATFPPCSISPEHVHDDYTPLWIKPGKDVPAMTGPCWWGSKVIAAGLAQGWPTISLPQAVRDTKKFTYPNTGETQALSSVREAIDTALSHIGNWVYYFNLEDLAVPEITGFEPSRLVAVASGFKWLSCVNTYPSIQPDQVILADYSRPALAYQEKLAPCTDFSSLVEAIHDFGANHPSGDALTHEEIQQKLGILFAGPFKGQAARFFECRNTHKPSRFLQLDFLHDHEGILQLLDPENGTLFWHSNAWFSHGSLFTHYPWELDNNYRDLVMKASEKLGQPALLRHGGGLVVFGSLEKPHTVFTDGVAGRWSNDPGNWVRI